MNVSYRWEPVSRQFLGAGTVFRVWDVGVSFGGFGYMEVEFGGEFGIGGAVLATGTEYYQLSVVSSTRLRLTKTPSSTSSTTP